MRMQGIAFPAVHALISTSVPRGFQSTGVAIVTAASYGGAAFAAGAAPLIIDQQSWPACFYVFGASALLWLPFWVGVKPAGDGAALAQRDTSPVADGEQAPHARTEVDTSAAQGERSTLLSPPSANGVADGSALGLDRAFWGLAKRKEVWAICAAQYCQSWGMYALLNWLPTFFSEQVRPLLLSCLPVVKLEFAQDEGNKSVAS